MTHVMLGVVCGLSFGTLAVASMLPMSFADKRAALLAAFVDRFAIGFVICVAALPGPSWLYGLSLGLLLSTPSAIVTRAWRPILGFGGVGGAIIGILAAHVAT